MPEGACSLGSCVYGFSLQLFLSHARYRPLTGGEEGACACALGFRIFTVVTATYCSGAVGKSIRDSLAICLSL